MKKLFAIFLMATLNSCAHKNKCTFDADWAFHEYDGQVLACLSYEDSVELWKVLEKCQKPRP